MKRPVLFLASALVLSSAVAHAQACLGHVSFRNGAARAGIAYMDHSYTGEVGYGSKSLGFATARFDAYRRNLTSFDASANRAVVAAGIQMDVGDSRLQVCPVAAFGLITASSHVDGSQSRPTIDNKSSGRRYEIGGALGYAPVHDGNWHVTPSVAVNYVRESMSGHSTTDEVVGPRGTFSYHFGLTTASLGITRNGLGIRPFMHRPFGVRNANTQLGVGASFNFGGR
jgi:hypothetical protein